MYRIGDFIDMGYYKKEEFSRFLKKSYFSSPNSKLAESAKIQYTKAREINHAASTNYDP